MNDRTDQVSELGTVFESHSQIIRNRLVWWGIRGILVFLALLIPPVCFAIYQAQHNPAILMMAFLADVFVLALFRGITRPKHIRYKKRN